MVGSLGTAMSRQGATVFVSAWRPRDARLALHDINQPTPASTSPQITTISSTPQIGEFSDQPHRMQYESSVS